MEKLASAFILYFFMLQLSWLLSLWTPVPWTTDLVAACCFGRRVQQLYSSSETVSLLELLVSHTEAIYFSARLKKTDLVSGAWVPMRFSIGRLHDPSHSVQPCFLKGLWTCYLPLDCLPECQDHFSFTPLIPFISGAASNEVQLLSFTWVTLWINSTSNSTSRTFFL